MRTRMDDLVRETLAQGRAVPALTCYDFSTALGVVRAAEQRGRGVILLVPPTVAGAPNGLKLLRALRALADSADAPVVVQLDHANEEALISASIEAGADAVLADGSALPFAGNVALVRRVIAAHPEVSVEAEIGALAGDEDTAGEHAAIAMTDPVESAAFAEASGAHLLAVAVGTVHGRYSAPPQLDLERLESIRSTVAAPLVLHGASGLPVEDFSAAASRGIGKVNINTELRGALLAELEGALPGYRASGDDVLSLTRRWTTTAEQFASSAFDLLDSR